MTLDLTPEDAAWAKKLKRSVAFTPLPSRAGAGAKVADEFAAAIGRKNLARLSFLLTTPPERLNGKAVTVDVNSGFADAFNRLGSRGKELVRDLYPSLLDACRTDPLTLAVLKGFDDGAKLLLESGAAPFHLEPRSPTGYNGAIAGAIFLGNKELMTAFMEHPAVQKELAEQPAFRNWLLLTAAGSDNAETLAQLLSLDPEMAEKGVIYGTVKAAGLKLGTGVLAHKKPYVPAPANNKYGNGPSYRPGS